MIAALLLHGFATSNIDFLSIMPFLEKRYDAIFLDNLPGHGDNGNLSQFTVLNVIDYVNKKFDEIKMEHEKVDVYGYSMGGVLATYLASNKDVNRVILLAPANKYINARVFAQKIKTEFDILTNKNDDRSKVLKENNRIGIDVVFNELVPRYNVNTISTFISLVRVCNDSLKENNVKTLLVRGDMDELVPPSSSAYIKKYFHNLDERIIPDLGHLMLKSRNYRLIINEIKDFLDED